MGTFARNGLLDRLQHIEKEHERKKLNLCNTNVFKTSEIVENMSVKKKNWSS